MYDFFKDSFQSAIDTKTADIKINIVAITALLELILLTDDLTSEQKWRLIATEQYRLPGSNYRSERVSLGLIILSENAHIPSEYFAIFKDTQSIASDSDVANVFNTCRELSNLNIIPKPGQHYPLGVVRAIPRKSMDDLLLERLLSDYLSLAQGDHRRGLSPLLYMAAMNTVEMFLHVIDCGGLAFLTKATYVPNETNKATKQLVQWYVQNLPRNPENLCLLSDMKNPTSNRGKYCASTQNSFGFRLTWENTTRGTVLATFDSMNKALNPPIIAAASMQKASSSLGAPVLKNPPLNTQIARPYQPSNPDEGL